MIFSIENFIYFFLSVIITVFFHEVGHSFKLSEYNNDKKILIWFKGLTVYAGVESDYKDLTNEQLVLVYRDGILYGLLAVTFFILAVLQSPFNIALLIFYTLSCSSDFQKIKKYGNIG